ncbi:hypothetical protein JAAARDRAFT_133417 [Jaapia argillacea MUCL 33604]|uniref:PWWP domain-containing protein n=1 Tax=Jaapia argillacea MUCL 33604 TaxID=933084 RepID=A0A067PLD7_9AGAM|nr:hypothetical protein JAAARDRAFT_133417 [Jaapia argillacea MUCL 33604]
MVAKKTKSAGQEHTYDLRDVVLAKVRGYPAWPGVIVDPESVPVSVKKERPSKKSNFYCVRFFPAGDYAWVTPKDMSKLQRHEIEAYVNEPFRKSGELLSGYKVALDPDQWEAELAEKLKEKQRDDEEAEVDQLESEGDEEKKMPTKSKKRKRESEAGASKPKAKPKVKKETSEPAPKKKGAAAAPKGKKNGAKSNAMVESEDEGGAEPEAEDEEAGPSKDSAPPPAKKPKRDEDEVDPAMAADPEANKVKEWRHRLQKIFLHQKIPAKAEDMPEMDELFTTVEQFDKMNIQYLQHSKIGKVMRHILALSSDKVPRDDDFKFRDRAKVLVDRWQAILNANKAATNGTKEEGEGADAEGVESKTETKGDAKMQVDEPEPEASAEVSGGEEKANGKAGSEEHDSMPVHADASMLSEGPDVTMTE